MHQQFSTVVAEFYKCAENAKLDECVCRLLTQLRTVIYFDGAALAKAQVSDQRFLDVDSVLLHGRDADLLAEYKRLVENERLHAFVRGPLLRSLVLSLDCISPQLRNIEILALARRHGIYQMLASSTSGGQSGGTRWVALFRRTHEQFTRTDARNLHVCWPHLVHCIDLNRQIALPLLSTSKPDTGAVLPLESLTRAELVAATLYAEGLSYDEIGRRLAVSHNTVRTHLAHSYQKLGIRRKTELLQLFSLSAN